MTNWEQLPLFTDHDRDLESALMGPQVCRRLTAFESALRGGCRHADRMQWALVSDLRSACLECAHASAALSSWASSGPCTVCGRLLDAPPSRVWAIESQPTGVTVCVRLCQPCSSLELRALADAERKD